MTTNPQGKPEMQPGDIAHTGAKIALSLIPFAGGAASEIFALIVSPPLEKRRDAWIQSIGDGLEKLKEKVESLNPESLSQNEAFVTTLLHASRAAISNHQAEKLVALRNAVLNAALPDAIEDTEQMLFIRWIDELTGWHLRILALFENPKEWMQANNIAMPQNQLSSSLAQLLVHVFPDLRERRSLYDQLWQDLNARGLLNTPTLQGMMTGDGVFSPRATDLGKRFLRFISSPID